MYRWGIQAPVAWGTEPVTAAIAIMSGPRLRIEYVNDAGAELLGDPSEYLGRQMTEAFPYREWHRIQALVRLSRRNGMAFEVEMAEGTLWVVPIPEDDAVAAHFVARRLPLVAPPAVPVRFARAV